MAGDLFPGNPKYYKDLLSGGAGPADTGSNPHADGVGTTALHDLSLISPAAMLGSLLTGGFHLGGGTWDKVESAAKGTNPAGIRHKVGVWDSVATKVNGHATALQAVMAKISGAWEGDDADTAQQILRGLYATLATQASNASTMSGNLSTMADQLQWLKDNYGHGDGGLGGLANKFTSSDDRDAANAYKSVMQQFKLNMDAMPKKVETEVKADGAPSAPDYSAPNPHAGAGGAPTVGGPGSAPHGSVPTPAHVPNPTLHPGTTAHPHPTTEPKYPVPPVDPTHTNQPTYAGLGGANGPGGVSPYSGGGSGLGLPGSGTGLDTGGSLSGLDGSGGGGAGLGAGDLGAGAGGAGAGGISGLGAGTGGLGAGTGGALGAGTAGGAGAGAGGAGAGAGGASGAGVGAAGGRGMMMPMHGAGDRDEDERERNTWLNEDEDVWGADEDVPGVIS